MQFLNADLDLEDLARFDRQYRNAASAFRSRPVKTPFVPGCAFMRVISTTTADKIKQGTEVFSSPWWTTESSFRKLLTDFRGKDPKDIFRGKLAITSNMSRNLDAWVEIVLTRPVYAWVGLAKYQPEAEKLCYIGGGEQVFLPNLDVATNFPPYLRTKSATSSNFAYIRVFSWTENLKDASRA